MSKIRASTQAVAHFLGHRLAGLGVEGELGQDLRHLQPVLVELGGQLHEVPGDAGATDALVGHVAQHLVQRVAELVEQRPRVVDS